MNDLIIPFEKRRIIATTVTVILLVNLFSGIVAYYTNNTLRQKEIVDVSNRYITFQQGFFDLVESGNTILKGFEAYLKVNGDSITIDQMDQYLAILTQEDMKLIRNIGIIQDTTIIHNYPLEGNELSIGIDLAQVPGQEEVILKTKNDKVRSLTGPIDLVQGGRGFIIRLPIEDINGQYWGQMSIVMYADAFESAIASFAHSSELDVVIFKTQENVDLIYGDPSILGIDPIQYPGNELYNDWSINVLPKGGWPDHTSKTFSIFAFGLILSAIAGFAVYYYQKINYDLQFALAHDHLTGLYNRYCLELAQKSLMDRIETLDQKFGIMLIDLDNFKEVNDTHGHNIGDEVLVETGRILHELTRKEELVFRIGGDEFLILIPDVAKEKELYEMKTRFEQDFMKAFALDGLNKLSVAIGPSMGVGIYPTHGSTFDEVLIHADRDMYDEKSQHKHR